MIIKSILIVLRKHNMAWQLTYCKLFKSQSLKILSATADSIISHWLKVYSSYIVNNNDNDNDDNSNNDKVSK